MVKVIGVKFREGGKVYYFDPDNIDIPENSRVIVETARGIELGDVVFSTKEVSKEEIVAPLKKVIRIATNEDIKHYEENLKKEKEAFDICLQKIKEHNLDMKLINVEYTFDNNKILFYFIADGRIDFRELVKDLASIFKTRIELRQIGVRDETKMLGGLGICGRVLCCKGFLSDFQTVSIKMAKEQGLSLNPAKISGCCGRLMCCLKYEHDAYEEVLKKMPRINAIVNTPAGQGTVIETNVLKETVKVKLNNENEPDLKTFHVDEINIIRDAAVQQEEEINLEADIDINILKELEG